jgi:hypothetical protein
LVWFLGVYVESVESDTIGMVLSVLRKSSYLHRTFRGIGIGNRRHPRRVRGRGPRQRRGRVSAKREVSDTYTPKSSLNNALSKQKEPPLLCMSRSL